MNNETTSSGTDSTQQIPSLADLPRIGAAAPAPAHARGAHSAPAAHGKRGARNGGSRKPRRGTLIALGVIVALLAVVYAGGVVAFSNLCYPRTSIADIDVSWKSRADAVSQVKTAVKDYTLTVEGDGFSWTFTPGSSQIVDAEAAVDAVIGANEPFAWPVRLIQALTAGARHAAGTTSLPDDFDQDAFTADLGAAIDAFNANRTGTFDAAGAYDESTGSFTVERARSNQKLDRDTIVADALEAVASLSHTLTLDEDSFTPLAGGATDEQLQAACDAANALIGTNVNLTMGGTNVATLDGAQLAQWITFDDALNPTLSTDPVTAWVRQLATTLDTAGTTRTYTRPDGKQISVSGGSYGWITDEAALVQKLQEAVANKQVGDIEIPTKQTADAFRGAGAADWGAYIDIDLSEQHARYYDASGNLLWESGIISGNPNKGNGTPTGVYAIRSNSGGSTLIGKTDPATGEPEYKTPVNYWMPFVGNAIGLHDASWQASSSFSNPSAYLSVGSHGCVNLPPAKAQELHNLISVGLCVVVHN